ncbi:hypothetical protein L873DRAFT_1165978 [Choiromyces venosus 120613-1]|uniref:BTB domain-containing protein n=1 Tax=Choiromyces venosus 120613-1 TaxID=1336337 RepID=A0A3N4JFH2_9PEZI|nr:hypothetical protein L873DRAFT_1165978 [Choiromyces venosus 120613-1]
MERTNISSFFTGNVLAIKGRDSGETVYVHKSLLEARRTAHGNCLWRCFSVATITNFVEYLYQDDYTSPLPAVDKTKSPPCTLSADSAVKYRNSVSYEEVFTRHAELFILARGRGIHALGMICLGRLKEAMAEAEGKLPQSLFLENMSVLIHYSYNPCCNCDESVWAELQKTVSEYLASRKGWLLEASVSEVLYREQELVKDLFAATLQLAIDTDKRVKEAQKLRDGLKQVPMV